MIWQALDRHLETLAAVNSDAGAGIDGGVTPWQAFCRNCQPRPWAVADGPCGVQASQASHVTSEASDVDTIYPWA